MHPPASQQNPWTRGPPPLKESEGGKQARDGDDSICPGQPRSKGDCPDRQSVLSQRNRDRNRLKAECLRFLQPGTHKGNQASFPPPFSPLFNSGSWLSTCRSKPGEIKAVSHFDGYAGCLAGWANDLGTGTSPVPGLCPWTPPGETDDCAFLEDPW